MSEPVRIWKKSAPCWGPKTAAWLEGTAAQLATDEGEVWTLLSESDKAAYRRELFSEALRRAAIERQEAKP